MAKEKFYRQCTLEQGTGRMVGYIEERGAKVGASVEVLADGTFWAVTQVGDHRMAESLVKEKQKTDIFGSIKV